MIDRRIIGLNYSGRNATFCTWAPDAKSILFKTAEFEICLERRQLGFWESGSISIEPGTPYFIVIDGKDLPDPASLFQPEGITGNSVAFDLNSYEWRDQAWTGILTEDLIIYEIHTGTFSDKGNFKGIADRMEHLKELGITAIEIMPVVQFPGSRNWGYDGVFPFAVQNTYGGPAELQLLVDKCHQNRIAVILDVVINHAGPEGSVLSEFGPFFTDKYKTPWGRAINYDDAWCDGVRRFFTENILMWLRDFHIDGIRLDAIHAIKDFGPKNILQEIHENVTRLNERSPIRHFLIGESDLNDIRFIAPERQGGYGLDATWSDEFHHALHTLVTPERNGYYSDFGNIWHLTKAFNDAFVYDGIWSDHRKKIFGTSAAGYDGSKFVIFSQNHDQIGNRMLGERLSSLVTFEQLKLVAGAVMFSPYIPLLFMGEEYAEKNPFLYFTSHANSELIRMVREGRKREFEAFAGAGEAPDPQDENTFIKSKIDMDKSQQYSTMLAYYKTLIRLRKSIPLWKNTNRRSFSAETLVEKKVLQLTRKNTSEILLAILNFEDTEVNIFTCKPYIEWNLLINSGDPQWGGPGNSIDIEQPSVLIPPHTMIILHSS